MNFRLGETSAPLLMVFLIILVGYLAGQIKVRGIRLGTAAIFLAGLVFGHLGAEASPLLQDIGLVMFLSAVGLNAGPGFLQRIRSNGLTYLALCVVIITAGSSICILLIRGLDIDAPLIVGILTGAFTTSPSFAMAKELLAADQEAVGMLSAGYGLIYPLGIIGKVLFIQLIPRLLHSNMAEERKKILTEQETYQGSRKKVFEKTGVFTLSLCILSGILLGGIQIQLPVIGTFSLGMTGGTLLAGIFIGEIGYQRRLDLNTSPGMCKIVKEIGLVLFFSGAGVEGGHGLARILSEYGGWLFLFGLFLLVLPMTIGFLFFRKILKIPLLNGMACSMASMTCTASLAVLIETAGTDDVAVAYATTYPIALMLLVVAVQILVTM